MTGALRPGEGWMVCGQAYGLPMPSGAVDVYAVTGHSDDRTRVWVVYIGTRARPGDKLDVPDRVRAPGTGRDVATFASVMLAHQVTANSSAWPRKKPRVSLPDIEGVLPPE